MRTKQELTRGLNDTLRREYRGGTVVITRGIEALGADLIRRIGDAVVVFDSFDEANDPHGEHDFGARVGDVPHRAVERAVLPISTRAPIRVRLRGALRWSLSMLASVRRAEPGRPRFPALPLARGGRALRGGALFFDQRPWRSCRVGGVILFRSPS